MTVPKVPVKFTGKLLLFICALFSRYFFFFLFHWGQGTNSNKALYFLWFFRPRHSPRKRPRYQENGKSSCEKLFSIGVKSYGDFSEGTHLSQALCFPYPGILTLLSLVGCFCQPDIDLFIMALISRSSQGFGSWYVFPNASL